MSSTSSVLAALAMLRSLHRFPLSRRRSHPAQAPGFPSRRTPRGERARAEPVARPATCVLCTSGLATVATYTRFRRARKRFAIISQATEKTWVCSANIVETICMSLQNKSRAASPALSRGLEEAEPTHRTS